MFGILEVSSRLIFPEFKGHIFSNTKSMNINYIDGDFLGYQVRSPYADHNESIESPLVLIFGDSISGGYGSAFEDIWWRKLERLLKVKGKDIKVISISGYGNNTGDSAKNIKNAIKAISSNDLNISKIIYQFNFNDILPFTSSDLESTSLTNSNFFIELARFRYEHANKSVFLRTIQHYLGRLIRKTNGTCIERGWHALGPYTWTFGSSPYQEEAENYWREFSRSIKEIKSLTSNLNIDFEIFISPILYDVDKSKAHKHYNYLNYDFSCSTIDPKNKLNKIAAETDIKIYDPSSALRESFELRLREGNFEPYFFAADDNHFTPLAANYIAEVIATEW